MANRLPAWRKHVQTIWLKESPAHPLQQTLRDLDRAYQNFFSKRAGFPTFKKKGRGDSFRYPEPKQFKLDQDNSRIANVRADYLHKTSRHISQNHAVVCVEDLKVCNMSRSASGIKQSPGKSVKAKSRLNRSILDQGWGEFRRQLGYKLDWAGGELIAVPAQYTSQKCSGSLGRIKHLLYVVRRC